MKRDTVIRLIAWGVFFSFMVWMNNFTIVGYFMKRNYMYSNYNGTFRYAEDRLKGKPYAGRVNSYNSFLKKYPEVQDKQLYRTFWLNPWFFWEWREWVEHFDRFTLPYISEREIQRNREKEGLNNKN